jgi:hypothetical protein
VRRIYLRNFAAILVFGLASALFIMFNLSLDNMLTYIFLKVISFGVIPLTLCFSWVWLWRDSKEPFRFLGAWNCGTLFLFLVLNVLRVRITRMGFFGISYVALSVFLIAVSLTDCPYTKYGSFITGALILLNVVFAFGMVMTTFDHINPYFARGSTGFRELGMFTTEVSVMGALLTASSQLYWHDILVKRREQMIIEQIFADLDADD